MRIIPCKVRGERYYKIEIPSGSGKRKRQFFKDRADAKEALDDALDDLADVGRAWGVLTAQKKSEVMRILKEIEESGQTLQGIWDKARATPNAPKKSCTLGQAIVETIAAKREENCRDEYIDGLALYLNAFAKGREQTPIDRIGVAELSAWFTGRKEKPITKKSNLGRLSSMFDWCWKNYYITENPCWRMSTVKIDKGTPKVLSIRQSSRAILWAWKHNPDFLAWLTLALFVGMRPKAEADHADWSWIDLNRKRITVNKSKIRGQRPRTADLTLCPLAVDWLRVAKARGAKLPITRVTRRRCLRRLRDYLGFEKWPQDILRHTTASNLMGFHQDAGKVATFLGNSAGVLLRDYVSLIYREDAERFLKLIPKLRHYRERVKPTDAQSYWNLLPAK